MVDPYQHCIEKLISIYTTGDFYREIYNAKRSYFADTGELNEDDPSFENQMDIFMGWYLFDRDLTGYDLPPVKLFYRKNLASLSEEEAQLYANLTKTVHSIFSVLKQKNDMIYLREHGTKQKFEVLNERYTMGFSKGDVFEARLIPYEKCHVFASGFCFHPKESTKFIDQQIKKLRDQDLEKKNDLLLQLNRMKLKHVRYPHIDVKHIYTLTPKF